MAYGPSELTGAVIALLEKRWVGVAEVQALLEPLPLADVARQIHFFRELKRLYRLLPVAPVSHLSARASGRLRPRSHACLSRTRGVGSVPGCVSADGPGGRLSVHRSRFRLRH